MYALLVTPLVRRMYRDVCAGQFRLVTRLAAPDVTFVFPGTSSFGGTRNGKADLIDWLRRFATFRPEIVVRDVVASGPPWNLRLAVRLDDTIGTDYHNQVAEMMWIRWGRLRRLEVFLDTERLSTWERDRATGHGSVTHP